MKTIDEFIQRLQNDPEFEQRAQAYENSDDFIGFVKSEGYNFTLDQLLDQFTYDLEAPDPPVEPSPTPLKTVAGFIQRLEEDPEFEQKARAFENDDAFMKFLQSEGYDFTLDQLTDELKHGKGALKPQAERPPAPLKAIVTPMPGMAEGSGVNNPADPFPHGVEEGQKRPAILLPKFEGFSGGRRRGIKWRDHDNNDT
jgi:predicted ribosomally synthesized peptide with nif11-like leader